jgi:OmcA/MtrC family decaheme c-type cytochrome
VADGSLPTDLRRDIVDTAKCLNCHEGTLYQHGGDRVDNTKLCVICHNPASNEKNNRVNIGVDKSEAYDGKDGQTYDFRTMIHSIHSAGVTGVPVVYYRSFGQYAWGNEDTVIPNWPTDADGDLISGVSATIHGSSPETARTFNFHAVTYPRLLNDCEACHVSGSYNVPDQAKAVAVTDDDAGASPWDVQTDDVLKGASAASCMSCHKSTDKFTQAALSAHAAQNGWTPAVFTNGRADILDGQAVETCVVCHGN